jgi:hypothetical protein
MTKLDAWIESEPPPPNQGGPDRRADQSPPPSQPDHQRRVTAILERERAQREARRVLAAEDRAAITVPALRPLRERLSIGEPEVSWRIARWQPRDSRVILAAPYKAGKTTLVANLIRSLVDDIPFLQYDAVDAITGTVVLLDTEMSDRQLDTWLKAQRIEGDDRVIVGSLRGRAARFNVIDPTIRTAWARRLHEVKASYLILDCLRPVLDGLQLDEHHDAGRLLAGFDALLAEAGVPEALIVHHMGHVNERSRGDSRLRDWPDVEWRLVRQEDNPASPRYLSAYGRDVDVTECRLAFDASKRLLTIAGGSRHDARVDAALSAVLTLLKESGTPLSGRAIEAKLDGCVHARDVVRDAVRRGIDAGLISTEAGRNRATLHYVRECAAVRGEKISRVASQCAAASMEPRTRAPLEGVVSAPTTPRTPDPNTLPSYCAPDRANDVQDRSVCPVCGRGGCDGVTACLRPHSKTSAELNNVIVKRRS